MSNRSKPDGPSWDSPSEWLHTAFGYAFLKVRLFARCDAEERMRAKRNPAQIGWCLFRGRLSYLAAAGEY